MLKYSFVVFYFTSILFFLNFTNEFVTAVRAKKHKVKDEMEGKIVGGSPIPITKSPYSVQIFNLGSMCAGTVLNSWTVLTAAHCFDINKELDEIIVQVGSRYVYDFNADQISVAAIVIHQDYNQTGLFACDIALLFLESPMSFSTKTKKAILVTNRDWMNTTERNFTVSGWGWTQYGGPVSKEGLMMTHLRYIPSEECSRLHKLQLSPDMFCLYGDGTRDTCKGDSGGGVFWKGFMVGITSHGDGCAKHRKPSVYANIFHFRKWIKKEVFKYVNMYCRSNVLQNLTYVTLPSVKDTSQKKIL